MSTSNPFKKAAAKEKTRPGGENKTRTGAGDETVVITETNDTVTPDTKNEEVIPEVKETPEAPVVSSEEEINDTEEAGESNTEEKEEPQTAKADLREFYAGLYGGEREPKSVRKQFTISPSLDKKLKKAVKSREIVSANHLVNLLLEMYFDEALIIKNPNDK